MIQPVRAKLGRQRKEWDWYVCPRGVDSKMITVQTDGACGMFHQDTGKGFINFKCEYTGVALFLTKTPAGKLYFPHRDTKPFQFPPEFVEACKARLPQSGDVIGTSEICGTVVVA